MTEFHERLRLARKKAGFKTATDAAVRFHWPEPTYLAHENGTRGVSAKKQIAYARAFKVDEAWLITGIGEPENSRRTSKVALAREARDTPKSHAAFIQEMDVQVAAGAGGLMEVADGGEEPVAEWSMPMEYLRQFTPTPLEHIKVIRVAGDSMVPEFNPGERLMVDISHRAPSPPGVYVLWDGIGLVLKRLEVIANSEPLRVRVIPRNKEYETYERTIEELHVNGRVMGHWQWK